MKLKYRIKIILGEDGISEYVPQRKILFYWDYLGDWTYSYKTQIAAQEIIDIHYRNHCKKSYSFIYVNKQP